MEAHPADKTASIYALTIGKPLPQFAGWFNTEEDQAKSPMLLQDAPTVPTKWGTDEMQISVNPAFYEKDIAFLMGDARVETAVGVVKGVRFDHIPSSARPRIVEFLKRYGTPDKPCSLNESPETPAHGRMASG